MIEAIFIYDFHMIPNNFKICTDLAVNCVTWKKLVIACSLQPNECKEYNLSYFHINFNRL